MPANFILFDKETTAVETGAPDKDRIVSGRPTTKNWTIEDDGEGLVAGIWEATPGEWKVSYTEWEFLHIIEGVSVLTGEGCEPVKLSAGDSFVIRPGFEGRWKVVEPTRKHYVVKS